MSYYENPLIGWYLKQRLKKVFAILLLCIFIYFIFFYGHTHKISYGCRRNDCESSACTGYKCRASGCGGSSTVNCKGGDCIGEACEAGDCKGVGCRAGDCYGLDCVPGECIDPTCEGERLLKNQCTPFCKHGKAYSIPKNKLYNYTSYLPKNTLLNPDFCSPKKRTNHLTNGKSVHNFKVDYINLYTSGEKKYEDVKYKDSVQQGKTYTITSDIDFISTTPNIYKNGNCEWCANFKNVRIASDFKPYHDLINEKVTWVKKSTLTNPLYSETNDSTNARKGKEQECSSGKTHEMITLYSHSVDYQIKSINLNNNPLYMKKWMIDQIEGEKLETFCTNCNKKWYDYLDIVSHPTNLDGTIIPCVVRSYEIEPIIKNYQTVNHKVTGFKQFVKDSPEFINYLDKSVNVKKTFRDHHLWKYVQTIGNTQIYECEWCKIQNTVTYESLPRNRNMNLLPCIGRDSNHYMYYGIDNNKTVFQKCLKCDRKSYPFEQKNI